MTQGMKATQIIQDGQIDISKMIFVFGSNEAGVHGAGAAAHALRLKGARWGQGYWISGQSFAIPTKDRSIRTLPREMVRRYVDDFLGFAREHPELAFQVTAIGCGLAGFKHHEIAPMFIGAPDNCYFDEVWAPWLDNAKFWGTF